jgi:hypothetical protein
MTTLSRALIELVAAAVHSRSPRAGIDRLIGHWTRYREILSII